MNFGMKFTRGSISALWLRSLGQLNAMMLFSTKKQMPGRMSVIPITFNCVSEKSSTLDLHDWVKHKTLREREREAPQNNQYAECICAQS